MQLGDKLSAPVGHMDYHVDRARIGLSYASRLISPRELSGVTTPLHDLQVCSMNTLAVATEIMEAARIEELLMGPDVSTWRAAARAIFEIELRGPCLIGDQDHFSRLPLQHLPRAIRR